MLHFGPEVPQQLCGVLVDIETDPVTSVCVIAFNVLPLAPGPEPSRIGCALSNPKRRKPVSSWSVSEYRSPCGRAANSAPLDLKLHPALTAGIHDESFPVEVEQRIKAGGSCTFVCMDVITR